MPWRSCGSCASTYLKGRISAHAHDCDHGLIILVQHNNIVTGQDMEPHMPKCKDQRPENTMAMPGHKFGFGWHIDICNATLSPTNNNDQKSHGSTHQTHHRNNSRTLR